MLSSGQAELIIGMMSGTSIDGIDAALVEFRSAADFDVLETEFTPFSKDLRTTISSTALNNSTLFQEQDSPLHDQLASTYAQAALSIVKKSGVDKSKISAVANHGQTVKHEPNATPPYSLQLGNGQLIANQTDITTITQFRQADLAAGGQGAPLMPAFHNIAFSHRDNSYVLNLGGIANITRLGNNVVGFDTGPASTLSDQWIARHKNIEFDQNGEWAASGKVIDSVLHRLMQDPYLQLNYPKSTGTDYYNLTWLDQQIPDLIAYAPEDIQATLIAFTVNCVEHAFVQMGITSGNIYVCGGGAHNSHLMQNLQQTFSQFSIEKTDALGVPSDWVEAVGFAWLGYCYLHDTPSNLPSVTGASKSLVLGQKYLPENTV